MPITKDYDDEDKTRQGTIGENTVVRLSLAVTLAGAIIGFTWWASGVQSSLNVLIAGQDKQIESSNGIRSRVEKLERDSDLFMQVGSPALRLRIEPLERWKERMESSGSPLAQDLLKRITAIEADLAAHKASDGSKKP